MIHTIVAKEAEFTAVASGRKSYLNIPPSRDVLVYDFVAINELHTYVDLFPDDDGGYYEATVTEPTGRCCLVEVTHVEMLAENTLMLASVRPCGISTSDCYDKNYNRNIFATPIYNRGKEVTNL